VWSITPEQSPTQAVELMIKNDIGRLPVVADGEVIGIVTRSDAMRYFYDLLPE
jgi:CBS domain-containing protein